MVYGDSSCLEGGAARNCHWLLLAALQYALVGHLPSSLKDAATPHQHRVRDVHIIPSGVVKVLPGLGTVRRRYRVAAKRQLKEQNG